uniref:TSC22 domain family member 1 n=1 Tax=Cyprinus carpio TaxID=7962 RepID=A0A8C2B5R4_CYPCA
MWKLLERLQVASQKELVLLSCVYNFAGDHPIEMNHHGDSGSARKMVYPMSLPKRESSCSSVGGSSTLTTSGSTSLNSNNLMLGDDYSSPVLIQSQTPAASSLGPQNPPQSLNIPVQAALLPQTLPTTVAQMKKKSGFQITSVTPAQTSVSTNNSIAEDTESCDDLDESHTEDLSSSEIMDVSLSRANNAGGPGRSSSEETLNNFHEAETPGAVSPNQPPILTQAHMHGSMVNGTVHHHHHNPASSGKAHPAGGTQIGIPLGATVTSAVTSSSGALASTGQKMPSNVVGLIESASVGSVIGQPLASVASGTGMISVTSGATVSTGNPVTNNVSMLNSASVPAVGGKSTNSSNVNYSPALNSISNQTVNLTHIPSGIIGMGITAATTVSGGVAPAGGGQVGPAVMGQHTMPAPSVPPMNAQPQQAQVPTPASTSSRFRVVKLDSTSEPFKKGRWTCTEYYDKEPPGTASSENAPSTRTVESIRQFVPESAACPDRESVSSTASHYTESLGSGETGGPSAVKQTFQQPAAQKHDYSSSHNVSMSQMQPQDLVHAHLKTSAVAPMPASIQPQQPPATMGGLQTTIGHSTAAVPPHMPKLTYAQAAQSPPAQALPVVTQQQMGYPPAQQPTAPAQVAPAHINPLSHGGSLPHDFPHSKQIMNTVPPGSTQTLPHLSAFIPPVLGNGQLIAASQQPVGTVQPPAAQPLVQGLLQPQQTPAPQMVQVVPQSTGAGLIQQTQGQQLAPQPSMEQQSQLSSQGRSTQFVTSTNVPPNLQSDPQSSLIQNGSKEPGPQPAATTLSSVMPTPQEDAQLLLQHPTLLTQPKPAGGEVASQVGTSRGPEGSGGVNALTASASLLKSLPVDGEEDGSG